MMEEIRQEIQKIEESAEKLKTLAAGNPSITRNAEIIQTFVYILRFSTPDPDAKG
jgi:hypothetical protein